MYWWGNRNPNAALYGVPCPVTKEELMNIWELSPGSGEINPAFWKKLPPPSGATDGASAFIVVPAELAKRYTDMPVYIDGVAYKCGSHLISSNMHYPVPALEPYDAVEFGATRAAVEEAYQMAKVEPKDIDFAQLYEQPFGPLVAMLEATKVPPKGGAADFIIAGETAVTGRLPTGTDGGRFGFGAPSGPDVSDAVYESVIQMRGKAGERQIPKADVCLIAGMQGPMASSPAMVLRRY
jgi:acetyl-CoA C-acetyltransferase